MRSGRDDKLTVTPSVCRHRRGGEIFLREALGVFLEQGADALGVAAADDESGVVMLLEAQDDFGRVEHGGVGVGCFREAEHAAGVERMRLRARDTISPRRFATSMRAHSRQRLTPVASSTTSAMKAPPTRAAASRK